MSTQSQTIENALIWSVCWCRSTSHPVAADRGCTNIPLAAGRAQEDETILIYGVSGHGLSRFVHLDPPGLIRSR